METMKFFKGGFRYCIGLFCIIAVLFIITPTTAHADDGEGEIGGDLQVFPVSKDVYENQYKNDSNYVLLDEYTQYRYSVRVKDTTTSGKPTLAGWTKYNTTTSESTSGYQFGSPIATDESYANGRKTVKTAVNKGYYYYAYSVADPSNTSDWTYYVAKSRASVVSHMKANFSNSATWSEVRLRYFWYISSSDLGSTTKDHLNKTIPYHKDSTVSVGTTSQTNTHYYDLKLWKYKQCYKVKTTVTINYFYQWSAWSAWSEWKRTRESLPSDGSKKEESETICLVKYNKPAKPLDECALSIDGPTSFEYDGNEKYINIAISDGEKVLEEGTDYYVDGNSGIDAGVYNPRITGMGDYAGELTASFTIEKTDAALDFAEKQVTKNSDADDFVNVVSLITDGQLSYSSSNPEVATVSADGTVSIIKKGKTTITVSAAEGKNYKAATASYELIVSSNLFDCSIEIPDDEMRGFEYDGQDKHLSIEIYDDEKQLVEGQDYTVTGNTGRDAGKYTVSIDGMGEYVGHVEEVLSINRAKPKLSFEVSNFTKKITDDVFSNPLTAETDGTIVYSSSDEQVATVDQSGNVSIKGLGSAIIVATAEEGHNYKQGKASYSLTVADNTKQAELEELSYSFHNNKEDFQYKEGENIAADSYRAVFGKTVGGTLFKFFKNDEWGGNCNGMSASSALLYDDLNDIHVSSFNQSALSIRDLTIKDKTNDQMSLKSFIEQMQVAQFASLFSEADKKNMVWSRALVRGSANLNTIVSMIQEQTEAGVPAVLSLRYNDGSARYGHAVLAYKIALNGSTGKIYIYDCNHPLAVRSIDINKNAHGDWAEWNYDMEDYGIWGTDDDSANCYLGVIPYATIKTIWENRGNVQKDYNMLCTNARSLSLYDVEDTMLAKIEDGEMVSGENDILIHDQDLSIKKSEEPKLLISMPIDVYTVKNTDESVDDLHLDMLNSSVGASVNTSADEVTVASDDDFGINEVFIDATKDDYYEVVLNSTLSGDKGEVKVNGTGSDDVLAISQNNGTVNVENCQVLSMAVDNQEVRQESIKARAYGHGSISPQGTTNIVHGTDKIYTIKPDKGYEIQDVIVDDESVGAVDSYLFKNVTGDHEIVALFEASSDFKRINNKIYAKGLTITSSSKVQKKKLNVTTEGITKMLYLTNNKRVTVSNKGVVSIDKNFIGKVRVTIISAQNEVFNQTEKTITIKVLPHKVAWGKLKAKKGKKMFVSWKTVKEATGYEIQYSRSKQFKQAKKLRIKGEKNNKTTIKKLKQKKYYVRIRAYKKTYDGILYSGWSKAKAVKVKK